MTLEKINPEAPKSELDIEKEKARKRFEPLIRFIDSRYRSQESTIAKNETLTRSFEAHNFEVLDSAIELGLKKGLGDDELMTLEIAAILHDLAKADLPAEELKDIKGFVVVNHHEMAAGEVENILKEKYPQILGLDMKNQEQASRADKIISSVKNAILCHMGPSPGFMAQTLKGVNEELEKKGRPEIVHPKPNDDISKILLAADMRVLAGSGGIQKILNIRANDYLEGDQELCAEYGKLGLELSVPEAALISASQSARDAVAMVKSECGEEEARWIQAAFDSAKRAEFSYSRGGEETKVGLPEIEEKMKEFEDRKRNADSQS